jgi:hypothetical protein
MRGQYPLTEDRSQQIRVLAPLRVAPVNRGHSKVRKGPIACLVGVVVLHTIVAIVFSHVWAMESPAIACAALLPENVLVVNRSPELQLVLGAIPHRCNLFFGHVEIGFHLETQFLTGEERQSIDDTSGGWVAKGGIKLAVSGDDRDVGMIHEQIGSRGGAVIFPHGMEDLVCFTEVFDTKRLNANIGTQLPLFGLLHDQKLPLASGDLISAVSGLESSSDQKPDSDRNIEGNADSKSYLYPKFYPFAAALLGIVFVIFFSKGFERFVEGGRFLSGAAMMCFGWAAAVAGVLLSVAIIIGH